MKSLLSVLKNHTLSTALIEAREQVKILPIDADKRAHWAQLLLLYGDWPGAKMQLQAWEALAPNSHPTTQQLSDALSAEIQREQVFRGEATPAFLTSPETWLSTLANAFQASIEQASELRTLAYQLAKESSGKLSFNHKKEPTLDNYFNWLADSDSQLGPVCELFIDNHYYWVPFTDIQSISFQEPSNVVHLVWRHSLVKWRTGQQQVCQIPARYPVCTTTDDSHRLGHSTDWLPLNNDGHYAGQGQKSWVTDNQEYPLLSLREVQFTSDEE